MRRVWLLLLVFVLPLQMSWAATHFCDDERSGAQAVVGAELGDHLHEATAAEQSDPQAGKIADTCCGAAHACHGLHHLVGQAEPEFVAGSSSEIPVASGAAPPSAEPISRVERPKWSAA